MGAFYRGWYVVVHLCSNFSVRRQMAPVQSIKFQTANFLIFCAPITVIFWATCIDRQDFFCCNNGNVTHILPVLHCLKRGIAFVSSLLYKTASYFILVHASGLTGMICVSAVMSGLLVCLLLLMKNVVVCCYYVIFC